jgi:hypothetical protein
MSVNPVSAGQLALMYGQTFPLQGAMAGVAGETIVASRQTKQLEQSLETAADQAETTSTAIDSTPTYNVQARVEENNPGRPPVGLFINQEA